MNRIPTCIKGFDELVEGGFPEHAAILLSGSPGTGKSIFAMEFIYNGALKFGDVGIYVSFEQSPSDIREQARQIGLTEMGRLEQEGKIVLMCIPVNEVDRETVADTVIKAREIRAKRMVIDSLSALSINAPIYATATDIVMKDVMNKGTILAPAVIGDDLKKNFIYKFIAEVKQIPITALLLSEIPEKSGYLSSDNVSEFAADGIILLTFESMGGDYSRSLIVRKMRMTKNDENVHPVQISNEGIKIHIVN